MKVRNLSFFLVSAFFVYLGSVWCQNELNDVIVFNIIWFPRKIPISKPPLSFEDTVFEISLKGSQLIFRKITKLFSGSIRKSKFQVGFRVKKNCRVPGLTSEFLFSLAFFSDCGTRPLPISWVKFNAFSPLYLWIILHSPANGWYDGDDPASDDVARDVGVRSQRVRDERV